MLKTGEHNITAITRSCSTSTFPPDVTAQPVDYDDPSTLVAALRGQDALVITLSGRSAIEETEAKLVRAAAEAGVKWILPNEWSPDTANEALVRDLNFLLQMKIRTRELIERLGQSAYVAVVTGFWYEYSLAKEGNYGFDFKDRAVTLFDEGEARISTSTWPHIGRAVVGLLSLPIKAEGSGGPCLEDFRNQVVYTSSFTVSQKDMLASACRVTGTKEADWRISKESARDRFELGQKQVQEGNMAGLSKVLYTRIFFPGDGNFASTKGTIDETLDIPQEDLDEATKLAVERQLSAGGENH